MTHIELSPHAGRSRVQSQDFNTHQVVAGCNALRQLELRPALVGYHVIHTPFLGGRIERVFPDLEPLQSGLARRRSIVNLRKPCRDGTLV